VKLGAYMDARLPMIRRTDGIGALVVVIVSVVVQHVLFNTTFTDSIGPAVGAAGGYLIAFVVLRRLRKQPNPRVFR
jgi:membrane associated rhomboid family serine protease